MHLRPVLAAAALAAASIAVPASSAAPTATVSGRVVDPAGRPVAGAVVHYRLDTSIGWRWEPLCRGAVTVACEPYDLMTRTDAAGRYSFALRTDRPIGAAGTRGVAATAPTGAQPAQTYAVFDFAKRSVRLPDLRFWHGDVSVDPALGPARVLRVPPLPPEYGVPPSVAQAVGTPVTLAAPGASAYLAQRGEGTVWAFGPVPHVLPVDARSVESGSTHVYAQQTAYVDGLEVRYRSEGRPVTGGVTPLSRGKACFVYGSDTALLRLPGCRLTDGRLGVVPDARYVSAGGRRCARCVRSGSVLVDLGAVRTVQAYAARHCAVESVWVSADGTSFTPLRTAGPPRYPVDALAPMLQPVAPAQARYVRFEIPRGCYRFSELSVFGPPAA